MTTDQPAQDKDERPILCGTDFSENAKEATDVAAAMAKKLGVKLLLAHVEEFRGLAMSDPGMFEAVIAEKRTELARETERVRSAGTVVEELFLSGSVFEELVSAATHAKARLLIVGAVGHALARRLLIGSVAERVAETSPLPTLVVRPGSALGAWIAGERPLKVLAGYDFSNASDAAARWMRQLLELGPCAINITHVDWPPEEANRLGYHGPMMLNANPAQMQSFLERDLRERVAMDRPAENVSLSVVPAWGRTDAHLLQIAHAQNADLVVVGTHGRHGLGRLRFGSVSRGVLHHAAVSVAVVPAAAVDRKKTVVPNLDRVLVATDFSDLGNEAVLYACAILRRGGNLKLIHVLDSKDSLSPAQAEGKTSRKVKEHNPKLLGQLRSLVPESAAHRFELEPEIIESDNAIEAIGQAAERFDADVVCLGSHGRSGLAKTLLGSVAQAVMGSSKRPVLVVRSQES